MGSYRVHGGLIWGISRTGKDSMASIRGPNTTMKTCL